MQGLIRRIARLSLLWFAVTRIIHSVELRVWQAYGIQWRTNLALGDGFYAGLTNLPDNWSTASIYKHNSESQSFYRIKILVVTMTAYSERSENGKRDRRTKRSSADGGFAGFRELLSMLMSPVVPPRSPWLLGSLHAIKTNIMKHQLKSLHTLTITALLAGSLSHASTAETFTNGSFELPGGAPIRVPAIRSL